MKIFDSIPIDEPSTELLQDINSPEDLRKLKKSSIKDTDMIIYQ